MGGTVTLRSEVGHGTCVTVRIPFNKVLQPDSSMEDMQTSQPPLERSQIRILVAEGVCSIHSR